jgi:hypothetical protein
MRTSAEACTCKTAPQRVLRKITSMAEGKKEQVIGLKLQGPGQRVFCT